MKVNIREEWIKDITGVVTAVEAAQVHRAKYEHNRNGSVKLDISEFDDDSITKLVDYFSRHANGGDFVAKRARTVVRKWIAIKECPDDSHKVSKLENLEPVLKELLKACDHGYLFERLPDGNLAPWFVAEIQFERASRRTYNKKPASVKVTLLAENAGGKAERIFEASDLRGRSLMQALAAKGLRMETPALMTDHRAAVDRYRAHVGHVGMQMSVRGMANLVEGWRGTGYRNVEQAGLPARMVVDIEPPPKPKTRYVDDEVENIVGPIYAPYWSEDEDTLWEIPVHPVLHMFDLDEHAFYRVHVNQIEPYTFDTAGERNLVLPPEQKDFIRLLIGHSKAAFQDIVKGKEGGTIVMLEGPPGVGKTLTAEIYAEAMERPLYRVHSSQIGIDPANIEKQLKEILERAERWGAILLIDEGDVFLRERGTDIGQNAVVGVFLRLLEYYRGVLFTTTNRGTQIDDAIVSRLTARFQYRMPSVDEQKQLWRVLGAQNGVHMPDDDINEVVQRLPDLSGRDIKNLLKLALVAAETAERVTPDLLVQVSRFRQARIGVEAGNRAEPASTMSPCLVPDTADGKPQKSPGNGSAAA